MDNRQLGLFDQPEDLLARLDSGAGWPEPRRFPYNGPARTVEQVVLADMRASLRPLLVTGYAALDRLIDFLAEIDCDNKHVRIVLGSEPYPARRDHISLASQPFTAEVEHYWLERGISMRLAWKVIKAIELLRQGRVRVRFVKRLRLHAKIYCAQSAVTLGSSNFSDSGLRHQLEANARFEASEVRRFAEVWQLAERYWENGDEFNDRLIALLEKLLKLVQWDEALARACAELLEGDWAQQYLEFHQFPGDLPLWPSQKEGIAQALFLLESVGSVLVADATGSGKTRMGAHLLRAAMDRIWSSGRARKGRPVLVCPPSVKVTWDREATLSGLPLGTHSHGSLSQASGTQQGLTVDALRRAQILAVDEAHNFLNLKSQRTRLLLGNMADHTVLFTATPINRSVVDLLRLIDMLGADNLEPSTLSTFEALLRRRRLDRSLTDAEVRALRSEIQRFTVRRTKVMLNRLVDRQPDAYRDAQNNPCRYPRHRSRIYALDESKADREIATQIREHAERLRGLAWLVKPIEMPDVLRRDGWTDEMYLHARLTSARRLPVYIVMATLRSSRGALLEHLKGTDWASRHLGIRHEFSKQATGNVIATLAKQAGKPPKNKLVISLPDWLTDPQRHKQACYEEMALYEEICRLAQALSSDREKRKTQFLAGLLDEHNLILAFDSRLITLALIRSELKQLGVDALLGTGGQPAERRRIHEALQPGSKQKGLVALCSDSMSEGVNLQSASCVVHLDMPSVVRIAEQRVGRVDRMNSPHAEISAWWPDDAPEFALRTDDRFIERYETVDVLLGSNLPLPPEIQDRSSRVLPVQSVIEEFEAAETNDYSWDGIRDAFAPVRDLIDGENRVIEPQVYAHYRHVTAKVLARVSLVRAHHPWAFFCLAGTRQQAPKWLLFRNMDASAISDLNDVCGGLREYLGSGVEPVMDMDDHAARLLDRFLQRLQDAERSLLPRKKQRALEEMQTVLTRYQHDASRANAHVEFEFYERLLRVLDGSHPNASPDWNDMAERWLDLIRPVWYGQLSERRRGRALLLRDLRPLLLKEQRLEFDAVREAFGTVKQARPLDEQVAACILGVAVRG